MHFVMETIQANTHAGEALDFGLKYITIKDRIGLIGMGLKGIKGKSRGIWLTATIPLQHND